MACDTVGDTGTATASITIANVAPTANAGGPYTVGNGVGLILQGSATDPSSVDMAAGFTYTWNFGDGTTATGTSPNPLHVYAARRHLHGLGDRHR